MMTAEQKYLEEYNRIYNKDLNLNKLGLGADRKAVEERHQHEEKPMDFETEYAQAMKKK